MASTEAALPATNGSIPVRAPGEARAPWTAWAPPSEAPAALKEFWRGALQCRACSSLAPWRKFQPETRGNPSYRIIILGEAPGRVSLERQRPFSNPANPTVRNAFARAVAPMKLQPEEVLYFSDVVKCWPASDTGANRSPTQGETATCVSRHLGNELAIVHPRVVFAFGARAAAAVLGRRVRVAELHGRIVEGPGGIRVVPLMHPSTINIAGMRRVGIRSIADYETKLAALMRAELRPVLQSLAPPVAGR